MSSVGLRDIPRTTSFRLALLFLGLFGAASLALFVFMYWQTAGYVSHGVDNWLGNEMASRVAMHASERLWGVNERATLDPDGHRPMALFASDGRWLAGATAALPSPLPPMDRPFDFTLPRGGEPSPFRGMLHRLASGDVFLVAQDMLEIRQFHDLLFEAMAWGGLVVLVLGLAGAAIVGMSALSRIDGVTRAIESIIEGDLSKRLPSRGTSSDLDRLIGVVNRMLDEIEWLMHEIKGVTDDVAHDLRTPLTRLLAGLERVHRRGGTVEDYGAAVEEAIAETRAILVTFGALLRIAEVEAGARRGGFTMVDLNTLATDVADFYEPLAEYKGVALSLEAAPVPAVMPGDPSLLFEAIGNLVDNAIKFTPSDGRVLLRITACAHRVGFEVSDSGPGIPPAERSAVLRRFHRAEKSRHTPGCGLGLSLVAAVAKLHGMKLIIEDVGPGCHVGLWRDHVVDQPRQRELEAAGPAVRSAQPAVAKIK
jgi:signal transduction histidine kinase